MKNLKLRTFRLATISTLLVLTLPILSTHAQNVPSDIANAAKNACTRSAESKGFQVQQVVSIAPSNNDGAKVVLSLTRDGHPYKLTCGYTKASGAVFDGNTGSTAALNTETPDLSRLWWLLLPLVGLPLLLWWARGHDRAVRTAEIGQRTYVGPYQTIVRGRGHSINIYSSPDTNSRVIGSLSDGQRITLSGHHYGSWAELAAQQGWVLLQYLETNSRYVNR